MPETKEKKFGVISNTLWVLKLNLKYLPGFTITRIIGNIFGYSNGIINSFFIAKIIDSAILYINKQSDITNLNNTFLLYGVYYVLRIAIFAARNYTQNLTAFKIDNEISQMMLIEKINSLSTSSLENPNIQNKITRYSDNRGRITNMSNTFFNIVGATSGILIASVALIQNFPTLALLIVLGMIPGMFNHRRFVNAMWKLEKDSTDLARRSNGMLAKILAPNSFKEVKATNAYSYVKKYFLNYIGTYYGGRVKTYQSWTLFEVLSSTINGAVIIFGIYTLINAALAGQITIGQITFFLTTLTSLGGDLNNLSFVLSDHSGASQRIEEMRSFLEFKDDNRVFDLNIADLKNPPLLELKNVHFKYPTQTKSVIKGINLDIKPGEKIAIVGENGAGKTTLVKLISNIYPVTSGQILVNGNDLNKINPDSWFSNLGILYQDYNTYPDLTAKENIAIGKPNQPINLKVVIDAAKKADAYEFINEYKDKFDQVLSERYEGGIRPSTGQWQKIAIARFFYRNAPILILDEPTASIDAVAEANIFDRIYKFIENKTVIIISHRFSTVRNADRIIVMDKGAIVEQGTHKELLALNGVYANAYNTQAKGYRD